MNLGWITKPKSQLGLEDHARAFLRWIRERGAPRGLVASTLWCELYLEMCRDNKWPPFDALSVVALARLHESDPFALLSYGVSNGDVAEASDPIPPPTVLPKGALTTEAHARALVDYLSSQCICGVILAQDLKVIYETMCSDRQWAPEYWPTVARHLAFKRVRRALKDKTKFAYVVPASAEACTNAGTMPGQMKSA